MNLRINKIFISFVLLGLSSLFVMAQGVPRTECFPLERLPDDQRKVAEELLLKAMDEAALYTIVGGLKPMSTGIKSFQLQVSLPRMTVGEAQLKMAELEGKAPDSMTSEQKSAMNQAKQAIDRHMLLNDVAELRSVLETWRCGDELYAGVQHFQRPFEGKRFLEVFVFNRKNLTRTIEEKSEFFSRWGVTSNSHPEQVLYAIESENTSARFAGYGYLFGYPAHAVRFFVQAADEETFSGHFVARDFVSIPTHERETNLFVYAVPKGHKENDADAELKANAAPILAEYRKRRSEYIGEGKKGVVELIRDWFCSDAAKCSPSNAKF